MGLLDKAKFWKKKEDEVGDLSDLGDFGLEPPAGAAHDLGGLGDDFSLPPLGEPTKPGMEAGVPTHMEEVHPTQTSKNMSDQFGLGTNPQQSQYNQQARQQSPQQQSPPPQQTPPQAYAPQYQAQYPAQFNQGAAIEDVAKEIEIMHAKLDAIRSSLDSINQRLATLERIATGDNKPQRYGW